MKRLGTITLLLLTVLPLSLLAQDFKNSSVACEIVEDDHKKIQCTFITDRRSEDRTVIFAWHSSSTPQDDRERTIILSAGHGSVYDYRYYYGRATGEWEISVKDSEDTLLGSTTFTLP